MAEPATALLPNNKDFVREWEVRNGHLPLSSNGEHEAGNGPAPSIIEFAALQVLQVCGGRKTRLAGLEPTASASAGLRSIQTELQALDIVSPRHGGYRPSGATSTDEGESTAPYIQIPPSCHHITVGS